MAGTSKFVAAGVIAVAALGARTYFLHYGVASAERWLPASVRAPAPLPHFDHAPRHGGLVLMDGDTHFEVLVSSDGRYTVYFSDAVRKPIPADNFSGVKAQLTQAGQAQETTTLDVDTGDARWIGRGSPIVDPNAIVRIGYVSPEHPYWMDIPVSAWPEVTASLRR